MLYKPLFTLNPTDNLQRTTDNSLFYFPIIYILIFLLSAGNTVRAIGDDIKIPFEAWGQINKFITPRVFGDPAFFEITAVFPFSGHIPGFRLFDQRLQPLFGTWIFTIIEFI